MSNSRGSQRSCLKVGFAAIALLSSGALPSAAASAAAALPQCPYPCGDNTVLFCPNRGPVQSGAHVHGEIGAGLGTQDGWDVRVFGEIDPSGKVDLPTFKVMIMDDENYEKYLTNPKDESLVSCKEEKKLNKDIKCLSLQTTKCKTHKDSADHKVLLNYTHVVIECEEHDKLDCMLIWSVSGIFMPQKECWSLGLPCGYWTALMWLVIIFGLGFTAFFYRDQLAELSDKVPVPDMFKGPWRIFSGRFNGVEEMEARLAQRGEGLGGLGGDSISGDGVKEPYQRL